MKIQTRKFFFHVETFPSAIFPSQSFRLFGEYTTNGRKLWIKFSVNGGVYVGSSGSFTMSGGAVSGNLLSGSNSYGREVLVNGTFKI
jgi:uncharacterized protein (DUF2062 family)